MGILVDGAPSTTRPADTNPCFGCQQGRLVLLRAGRCLRSFTGQAAVHPQRRRPTRVLSQALRTHHPASPRPSLVAGPRTVQFRLCVLAFRCLNASTPPYLAESVRRTADVEGRRHLRSSTTMMLVVPSVQRLTLGDRAFPVAASRAWNSLPPAIRTLSSFISFRQQLKTHLFRLSFG